MATISEVSVLTLRAPLPEVIYFGDWVMRHREFALVRLRTATGAEGFGFTLTREAPIAAAIRQAVAHHYIDASIGSVEEIAAIFHRCQGSNLASLASGAGLRALSIVDLAAYDLLGKASGVSIASLLGGTFRSLPATAIIGYPPSTMGPEEVRAQVASLRDAGWRRFKIPIALPLDYGVARLWRPGKPRAPMPGWEWMRRGCSGLSRTHSLSSTRLATSALPGSRMSSPQATQR